MDNIVLPEIKCVKESDTSAVFVVEPLYPGYGVTIGNSLRRTLLSSLEGAAITAVKIEGATHEFSTLPHVKEDLVEIVLNLKKVRLKMHTDQPVKLQLSAKKTGPVTADLFSKNPDIEIVNPDLVLANLDNNKGKFEIEVTIEKGRGYLPTEQRENEKNPIGTIAIDALFNPVIQVNFNVENTRVGGQTNLDKLTIEIITDGTVKAKDTLDYAANILVSHFSLFTSEGIAKSAQKTTLVSKEEAAEDIESIKVEEINLSTRTLNALLKNDIKTIGDVFKHYEDLPSLPGLGARAITEIKEAIARLQAN